MKRFIIAAIGALPIVTLSVLPQSASAEAVPPRTIAHNPIIIVDRDDNNQRDRDWRNNDHRRDNDWRNNQRDNDWRNDRRDNDWRHNRRDNQRRVWIPGHWERGFLGIGRKWVAGHYETR